MSLSAQPHPLLAGLRGGACALRSHGAGLAALATGLLLYLHAQVPHGLLVLAGAAGLFAALTHEGWRGKPSVRIAGVLLLAIVLLLRQGIWDASLWSEGLTRYRSVIALLLGIALLQRAFRALDASELLRATLARADARWIGLILIALAALLALPLSLATVSIMTTLLAGVVTPPRDVARLSMRMVGLSMYLLPTTVASAAVHASIPGLHGADILALGIPLFLLGALLNIRIRPQLTQTRGALPSARPLALFALAFSGLFALCLAGGLAVPEAVGLSGLGVFALDARRRGVALRASLLDAAQAAKGCSAEVILMFACGLLACTLLRVGTGPSALLDLLRALWAYPGAALGVVLLLLPAVSVLGIHPLILFNVIFPLVDNSRLGGPAAQYIAWVSMFMLAQLVSPVSISAILAASALGASPAETSYKLHRRFAVALALAVMAYLLAAGRWPWLAGVPVPA